MNYDINSLEEDYHSMCPLQLILSLFLVMSHSKSSFLLQIPLKIAFEVVSS